MKRARPIFWLIALLLLAAMACNFAAGDEEPTAAPEIAPAAIEPTAVLEQEVVNPTDPPPTPTEPPPTDPPPTEPPPTEVPATEEPTATEPASAEDPVAETLALDTASYIHPLDYFEINPPAGWLMEEGDGGATFSEPDGGGFIEVEVTNAGADLDGDSFERFVDARELNFFGDSEGYQIIDYQIDPDFGVARVTKEFVHDGIPQTVFTYYDLYGSAMYATDFWADSDEFAAYEAGYEAVLDSMLVNHQAVIDSVDPYYWIYTFYGPGDLFSIDVPIPWTYEMVEGDVFIVDTFTSPDEHAFIENITYDDGEMISRSEAGAFALELLKEFYAADIQISDDQVQPDGSERLNWRSPSGEYSGISFLETRGTIFLLYSSVWDDAYEDAYLDSLKYTIDTYDVPE
ncbi:MAG: hypothetical protein JSW55_18945 [Chloroflexota bacterium]|nr:MAG: hypothetical protein JSW55_18945 [Chloroflexota bacterium]